MRRNLNSMLGPLACLLGIVAGATVGPLAAVGRAESTGAKPIVRHCVELAGISSGICSILGCDDGAEVLAAASSGRFLVHALDPRDDAVQVVRAAVDAAGLDARRVVVERGGGARLPYADNMVDLVLAVRLTAKDLESISPAEIVRALRPGGKAVLGSPAAAGAADRPTAQQLEVWLKASNVRQFRIEDDALGRWAVVTKPVDPGFDSWSHWEHGPDNNPVSLDTVIKAPYRTQWLGLPLYIAMPAITTSAGGRLFIAMGHIAHHRREEPWLNTLLARNAYNGSILWKQKLPDGYLAHRSAFVATDDTFYMIDGAGTACLLLDPETGRQKDRIAIAELPGKWKWMAIQEGILYALGGPQADPAETTIVRSQYTHWSWGELSRGYYTKRAPWGFGQTLVAYDLKQRKTLWSHHTDAPIDSRAMALGGGRVFFYGPDLHVGCLDDRTGQVVWVNRDENVRRLIEQPGKGLSSTPGFRSACFSLYTPKVLVFEAQTRMNVVAIAPEDGHLLWQKRKTTNNPNVIYVDDHLYIGVGREGNTLAIDPRTGETLEDLGFRKRSCARLTATSDSFFCRGVPEGLMRYDRRTKKVLFNGAFRPSCNDGVIAANGMLYLGPWACDCNLSVMGRVALCSAGQFRPDAEAPPADRLEKGTAGAAPVEPLAVTELDWPTYRGNVARTAASGAAVSGSLARIWEFLPDGAYQPTAPTAAGGLIFLGGDDGKIRALDASSGQKKWTFQTAGPIMQPPTIDDGRAYVGSGDGHIYALEATSGRLLWRFRVAPIDRRIMVYGVLTSTWPVHSGVLVQDGVAYAAAGIVDYDGTYVCALDAKTGQLKWLNDSSGHLSEEERKGVSAQGVLTIAGGRLWLAGGNVVSPAAYDLETGAYVAEPAGNGSPRANRGEEVAVFADRYVVQGGRLHFSAVKNVVNPGTFAAYAILPGKGKGPAMPVNSGKIPPAWNAQHLAFVDGRRKPPAALAASEVKAYFERSGGRKRPKPQWVAKTLSESDTVSLVVARGAILAACETPRARSLASKWQLCALDAEDGNVAAQLPLPSAALPGGLLVDRDGRVVVVLESGGVLAFGGREAFAAYVQQLATLAEKGAAARQRTIDVLLAALQSAQSAPIHDTIVDGLRQLGVEAGEGAERAGCIGRWHVLGTVPYDPIDHRLDETFIGEPNVDVTQPQRVDGKTLAWREIVTDHPEGTVDLVNVFGPPDMVAIYAYAEVDLPDSRQLLLKIGSNDGFKCWFNEEAVGQFDGGRMYAPDQDTLKVQGRKGTNTILLKITQHGGLWAFSARLTDPANQPIDLTRTE